MMRVLFSPLGLSYGALFSAIVLTKPDEVVVVTSEQAAQNLPKVLEAVAVHYSPPHQLTTHHFLLSDPFTGFSEGRALARELVRFAGKENIVNLVGGTTAMQDCLSTLTRLIACRQIAVIDRRPIEEQRANPFVVGELFEVPPVTDFEEVHIGLLFDAVRTKAQIKGCDVAMLERAFAFAKDKHGSQQRDCGTLHIGHVVRVCASILFEFEMPDSELLAAALLHDVLEDGYPPERWEEGYQTLCNQFGQRVADMVRLVTKPEEKSQEEEAEIDRKYLEGLRSAPEPLRGAVLLKLADRLDNVRSMRFNPRESKRSKYIAKTEALYLPLAAEYSGYAEAAIRAALDALRSDEREGD